VRTLQEQSGVVARPAARVVAGQRAQLTRGQQMADNLRYLSGDLHRLLVVAVLGREGLLKSTARQAQALAQEGDSPP
jgi:hypothetical protein